MEPDFWHQKWAADQIAFHEDNGNALLKRYFHKLNLSTGSTVFLPLCGKTHDIGWLLTHDYTVIGCELSAKAVEALFAQLHLDPETEVIGSLKKYHAGPLTVYQGDIFDLTADVLGPIDAIYDRAALVALPDEMRARYAQHLLALAPKVTQFLLTLSYNQSLLKGPPFSLEQGDIEALYATDYFLEMLEQAPVKGGLKGGVPTTETAWLLNSR